MHANLPRSFVGAPRRAGWTRCSLHQSTSAVRLRVHCRFSEAPYPRIEDRQLTENYEDLLKMAEFKTFDTPADEVESRGPVCMLGDGEHLLQQCVALRPKDLRARTMLLRNLMLQDLREKEVPPLAIVTLREAGVGDVDVSSPTCIGVLQVTLLGLKALYKMDRIDLVADYLAAAQAAVPGMAEDMTRMAGSLEQQFSTMAPEERMELLSKRSYLSCIDLQFVAGRHHADSEALLTVQE